MTLSLNATHKDDNGKIYQEYDVHSLFGLMQQKETYEFQKGMNLRPFSLSRSTFASSGRFTSHWLGDNYRTWDYLKYSIAGIFNMNMFGIPHVGADVCGFFGDRDDELCARWVQLATFYPFARNHYNLTNYKDGKEEPAQPSEPYVLNEPYKTIAKNAIYRRLEMSRYIYTQLAKVHREGGSMFSPYFYYFPNDPYGFLDIEETIMVGEHLKVSPVVAKG